MEDTRWYLLEFGNGTFGKIEVPKGAKVTFGPLTPVTGDRYAASQSKGLFLRVYKTQTEQLAIFPDVVSFRDLSFGYETLRSREGNAEWVRVTDDELLGGKGLEMLKDKEVDEDDVHFANTGYYTGPRKVRKRNQ